MNARMIVWTVSLTLALASFAALAQVQPPGRINYQGVVRDSAGTPLSGPVTMTFRFYDGPSTGTLLWEEIYDPTVYPPQVTIANGLFTVALGDTAHRNAGSETVFATLFANHADVYLAVRVAADAEMSPRIRVVSAPFAQNCDALDGKQATDFISSSSSGNFLDTSSTTQTKTGTLILNCATGYGVEAYGPSVGGHFKAASWSGEAYLGNFDQGIKAKGISGGRFETTSTPDTYADVANGNFGIRSFGPTAGGYFANSDGTSNASVSVINAGIDSYGLLLGGYFHNSEHDYAQLALGDGYYAGIRAIGSSMGGSFKDYDNSGTAEVAFGDYGIYARGNTAGGYFKDFNSSGEAYAGYADDGIWARGNEMGGYFRDADHSGYAYVGFGDYGVQGFGSWSGGHFVDSNSTGWGDVGNSTNKIVGSGAVSFVQNHPSAKDKIIVYACPEGDEVATYTRGTAKLVNGEARVKLGETFQWVTNPDLGLTAHLTAHGKAVPLAVTSLSTTELVVAGPEDVAFDYLVYGLRIGFEESSVVQEKQRESYIPSFNDHRARYAKFPELRAYNALERFKAMESSVRGVAPEALDLSRARALKDAVHEYDPATDPPVEKLFGFESGVRTEEPVKPPTPGGVSSRPALPAAVANPQAHQAALGTASAESETTAPAATASLPPGAERLPVARSVSAGDVLVMIPADGSALHPCAKAADPMVVGVALQDPLEGTAPVATFGTAPVKADASQAPIAKGDLLVTSTLPGHAMKAPGQAEQGTVIGKALEPLESGTGVIKVLVMLR